MQDISPLSNVHKAQHGKESVWPCHLSFEEQRKGPKPEARLSHPSMPALGPVGLCFSESRESDLWPCG